MDLSNHNVTVLIVDDDLSTRMLMRASLESEGYHIVEAENGVEAVELFKMCQPNIVLMDIQMPVMNGFQACTKMRQSSVCENTPILIITGLEDVTSIEEAYQVGATDFITKPIDWLILKHRVRYMLRASNAFEALRQQGENLEQAQRIAKMGNWQLDLSSEQLNWSDETYRIFGLDPSTEKITFELFNSLIHPEDQRIVEDTFKQALESKEPYRLIHRVLTRDKETKYVEEQCENQYDENGNPVRSLGTVQDITERMATEKQIRTLSQAIEQSPVSVVITDTQMFVEYVNKSFQKSTGYTQQDIFGKHTKILNSEKTPIHHYKTLWKTINAGKSWHGELQNRKKDGSHYWVRANIAPVFDDSGIVRNFLLVGEDITLYKKQEERIRKQAYLDDLTQLPNRFLALDRLLQTIQEAHRYSKKVALLFLDLDNFKKVNDSLGHAVGDRVLVEAAKRLKDAVRLRDTVGRLGGDEFVVILGDLDHENQALAISDNILNRFREPFSFDHREFVLTTSIGISIYPNDGMEPAELLRQADTAMYQSKEEGRNTISFITPEMNEGVARRLSLEEELRNALKKGEFSIHYQPLIGVKENAIIGAEALLRWNNPKLGFVSPDEFIPISEQLGSIIEIGRHVLTEAIRFGKKCREMTQSDFSIAINISPVQFRDNELTTIVEKLLKQNSMPGSALSLEITEGLLLSGHKNVTDILSHLNNMGIKISMDDFGTGYSSFNYLRQYPFSILKIDRSYIQGISVNQNDHKLVSSIISMARGLGLIVVAEGVETKEQLVFLRSIQCDRIQGYYYSKPLPASEFFSYLSNTKEFAPEKVV